MSVRYDPELEAIANAVADETAKQQGRNGSSTHRGAAQPLSLAQQIYQHLRINEKPTVKRK
jgi:hypothetical protein